MISGPVGWLWTHGVSVTGVGAAVAFVFSVFQFLSVRKRESREREFEHYHLLIQQLVSPDEKFLDRQIATAFELRHFPHYWFLFALADPCKHFRRFRVTHLRKQGTPGDLLRFWIGHGDKSVTDRYAKISQDVSFRKSVAEQVGIGFNLEVVPYCPPTFELGSAPQVVVM